METTRSEERKTDQERKKLEEEKRTIEIWIFKYKFPGEMKKENYGERNTEIEKDIKHYLCLDLLKKVSSFATIYIYIYIFVR